MNLILVKRRSVRQKARPGDSGAGAGKIAVRGYYVLAAAAVVVAVVVAAAPVVAAAIAAPAVAAAGEQKDEDDDPPAAVATKAPVVTAHNRYLREIILSFPLVPCYSFPGEM